MAGRHRERVTRSIKVSTTDGDGVHCPRCGGEFSSTGRKSINGYCRPCYYSLYQIIRARLPDVIEGRKEDRHKQYHTWGRHQLQEYAHQFARKIRLEVIEAYGGECECCGETIPDFLTIDHINGRGTEERRRVGKGSSFYNYLKRLGYPKGGYRLLCFNCNIVLGQRGYCPHQDIKVGEKGIAEAQIRDWSDNAHLMTDDLSNEIEAYGMLEGPMCSFETLLDLVHGS